MTNEPLRDVLLDNKQTVYGVPDEITDEEVKDAYAARPEGFNIIEDAVEEAETLEKDYIRPDFKGDIKKGVEYYLGQRKKAYDLKNRDIVKATVNMGANAYETVVGGLKSVFDQFETKEEKEQFFVNLQT